MWGMWLECKYGWNKGLGLGREMLAEGWCWAEADDWVAYHMGGISFRDQTQFGKYASQTQDRLD